METCSIYLLDRCLHGADSFAYVLPGNQYSPFAIVMVYAGLAGLAIGIFGGFYTIVSNRTVEKESDTEDQKIKL